MLRRNSPFGNDTNSYVGSIQSNGYSTMDEASSQISSASRLSGKSIYLQRKEYVASINKMMSKIQYRVEHLFTCDLDGKNLRNVTDCVERLRLLDGMGRVWGQSMLLEVNGAKLLLTDSETKEELESMALTDILEVKAVLDSGVFNSLLTVSVQSAKGRNTTVFMFQCEDVRADYIRRDLSRALLRKREEPSISKEGPMTGFGGIKNLRQPAKPAEPKEQKPAVILMPQSTDLDHEDDDDLETEPFVPQKEDEDEEEEEKEEEEAPPPRVEVPSQQPFIPEEEPLPRQRPYTELDRNVDILNHILGDLEIFMGQIAAVEAKNAKKKKKKKKGKVMDGMPTAAEFTVCFQKIKCGFNLLGELNGKIHNPGAPDFVHSLFSILAFVVSHCPEDLPQTIVAPLLEPLCIRLMSEEASAEEDELWQSLGDAWNIPSTKWPEDDEDIPTYTLEFSDGWQPPEVSDAPGLSMSRQGNQHAASSQASAKRTPSRPPQNALSVPSKLRDMRVMQDFSARNHRELSVKKGEMVELLDMSKQWWKVRNSRGEEGFVPNNVLESPDEQPAEQIEDSPVLTKKSKAPQVKAWLEDKGFSKITVRCLGVLSGSMLLGMTREELKSVCPEEGGRVFYQLQTIKSSMAAN